MKKTQIYFCCTLLLFFHLLVSDVVAKSVKVRGRVVSGEVKPLESVPLSVKGTVEASIEEALKLCFSDQPFTYSTIDKMVVIKEIQQQRQINLPALKKVQAINVQGRILNELGEPLIGATIVEKGTKHGTASDNDGNFSISLQEGAILVISYVGYDKKEIKVNTNGVYKITLNPSVSKTEEIVVIGYGTSKRKDLTGSVSSVNISATNKAPVKSIDDALAGRVAGMRVSSSDGQPGSSPSIVIRGANSVTQDNTPLYVIDGFPIENFNFNTLNPSDVESIVVLKDASSTAIYGSRGANGVIMVTTKKGKDGLPSVNFNAYTGMDNITKKMHVMSPYDFVKLQWDFDSTATKTNYLRNGKTFDNYQSVVPIDWQDMFFKKGITKNYDLSISGGNQKTKYSISGSVFDQSNVIINSGFKRYQGRITLDNSLSDKIKVGINLNYANSKSYGANASSGTKGTFTPSVALLFPVVGGRPVMGDSVDIIDQPSDPLVNNTSDYRTNPILEANNQLRVGIVNNLIVNGYLDYDVIKNLKFRATGGIIRNLQTNNSFNNSKTLSGNINTPQGSALGVNGSVINLLNTAWSNENTLTYSNVFNKKHNLNVVAGFSSQTNQTSSNGVASTFLPNESLGLSGLDEGTPSIVTAVSSQWFLASAYGRINYNYLGRYLFTATYRADGSSKFVEGNKWGYFPSMAAAWRFSDEQFVKKYLPFINEGKLRYSYGVTGNNRVSDFPYLSTLSFSNSTNGYPFNNTPTSWVIQGLYGNPKLKWETTSQSNFGLDLSLFKQRIQLTVDYYKKVTSNLLLNASLPYATGFASGFKNIGQVSNQGIEISLTTKNIVTKNFSWISNFNIDFNKSNVDQLNKGQESLLSTMTWNTNAYTGSLYMAKRNNPIALFYGYLFDGIYQYADFEKTATGGYVLKGNVPNNGTVRANIQPGDMKYKDINEDGIVSAADQTIIGNPNPLHTGGFSNDFTYKNFDLNIFFQWSYGNDIFNANRISFEGESPYVQLNQLESYKNRWTPTNPSNTIARIRANNGGTYNSRVIEDGSYLRLKTLQLGYNLPNKLIRKLTLKGVRVYSSVQNLITWTNYTGYDPEVSIRNSALTPGFDYSAYPRSRTVVFGVNVSF